MRWLMIIVVLTALPILGQQVIAKDSTGLIVEVKEKYGGLLIDTCTVVMFHNGQFILVKKSGNTGWFPSSFHSVRVIDKLVATRDALANNVAQDNQVALVEEKGDAVSKQ